MRENVITCDICGKLVQSTPARMVESFGTEYKSVKITLLWNGADVGFDACPRCLKRMVKYLKREAKKSGGAEDA